MPFDISSLYRNGNLDVEVQPSGLDYSVPPGQGNTGIFGLFGNINNRIDNALALKQQAALQAMEMDRRRLAMEEGAFSASMADRERGQHLENADRRLALRRQREADMFASQDRNRAQAAQQRALRERGLEEAAYGQHIGGANIVPGLISASGNTPGAVMTGHRRSRGEQGGTSFASDMGGSRASLSSDGFQGNFQPQFDSGPSAGERTGRARRELIGRRR